MLSRRDLLRSLLTTPFWLAASGHLMAEANEPDASSEPITAPDQALNVFDLQRVARQNLSPAHYTYLSMGVEDEVTLRANRTAFSPIRLRPRRLVDVREIDTRLSLLDTALTSPILLAPIGSQRAYHPDGEIAVARAARRERILPIVAMSSSAPLEEVAAAYGGPVWAQIYGQRSNFVTRRLVREAEAAGCPALVLTVDIAGLPTMRERIERFRQDENPECRPCHESAGARLLRGVSDVASGLGIDLREWAADSMRIDWSVVDRIRDATGMKLLVKGILSHEDAALCVEHGVDGIIVSNHGGRAEDNGLSTIEVLPEIVRGVEGRMPVLIDSGFRRGTDVFKALALGASAVCVGRPYVWGLAAFGQAGVEAVLDLVKRELVTIMRQMGTTDLGAIGREHVRLSPRAGA